MATPVFLQPWLLGPGEHFDWQSGFYTQSLEPEVVLGGLWTHPQTAASGKIKMHVWNNFLRLLAHDSVFVFSFKH